MKNLVPRLVVLVIALVYFCATGLGQTAPAISSLSPSVGPVSPVGGSVSIKGTNFGATQANSVVTFGGITVTPTSWTDTSTRKHLKRIAKAIAADRHAPLAGSPSIKAGARLVRQWNGKVHVVTVLAEGFEYGGKRFANLSEIARLIIGTRWSGPLFFGLRAKHKERRDV